MNGIFDMNITDYTWGRLGELGGRIAGGTVQEPNNERADKPRWVIDKGSHVYGQKDKGDRNQVQVATPTETLSRCSRLGWTLGRFISKNKGPTSRESTDSPEELSWSWLPISRGVPVMDPCHTFIAVSWPASETPVTIILLPLL